jgi:catechol 2,3-dioxygenase-like lactoylglutathione lyase family enzyme
MTTLSKARAIGFNHVALEVGDIDEALAFYGRLFDFELRSKDSTSAFIDLGDQFIAIYPGMGGGPKLVNGDEVEAHAPFNMHEAVAVATETIRKIGQVSRRENKLSFQTDPWKIRTFEVT